MARLKLIVAALVFFGILGLGTGLIAQQGLGGAPDMDPTIRSLIEARVEVAKEVYEALQPQRIESLEDMAVWSRRRMDEQNRLDPRAVTRLAAIQDHLDRTKSLEALAQALKEAARASHADLLKLKYYRLEAEQMIAEIRIMHPELFPPKPAAGP